MVQTSGNLSGTSVGAVPVSAGRLRTRASGLPWSSFQPYFKTWIDVPVILVA